MDDQQLKDEEFAGRRAMDKMLARAVSRSVGDIAQHGATPAIVIQGDVHIGGNNVICFGNCTRASEIVAELAAQQPKAAPKEPPTT